MTDDVEKVMHGRDGRATMHGQDAHATNGRNSRLRPASLSGFTEGYAETSEATPGQGGGRRVGVRPVVAAAWRWVLGA